MTKLPRDAPSVTRPRTLLRRCVGAVISVAAPLGLLLRSRRLPLNPRRLWPGRDRFFRRKYARSRRPLHPPKPDREFPSPRTDLGRPFPRFFRISLLAMAFACPACKPP